MFDMGIDFFGNEFGEGLTPTTVSAKKAESKKAEKKETTAKKSSVKKTSCNSARKIMVTKPVTVSGRNFTFTIPGEGELSLQDVGEELLKAGYEEVKHGFVKLFKVTDQQVILTYALTCSDDMTVVDLPVTVCDGMTKAVFSSKEELNVEEDDDVTLADIKEAYAEAHYKGLEFSYDASGNVILPVMDSADSDVKLIAGDRILVNGEPNELTEDRTREELILDFLGETPDGTSTALMKAQEDVYFMYLEPTAGCMKDAVALDRSSFGCVPGKTGKKAEEKILLPVNVYLVNLNRTLSYQPDDFGKEKVTWEELQEKIKNDEPILRSKDRKMDHLYDKESNLVSATFFSGTKGNRMRIENSVFLADAFIVKKKIPRDILGEIVNYFSEDLTRESIVQVWYDENGFKVVRPYVQRTSRVSVEYKFSLETRGEYICTIHSHNTLPACFSNVDDSDELYVTGLYGVIGSIREENGEILFTSDFRFCFGDGNAIKIGLDELFEDEEDENG